jgi:hypothetical protein
VRSHGGSHADHTNRLPVGRRQTRRRHQADTYHLITLHAAILRALEDTRAGDIEKAREVLATARQMEDSLAHLPLTDPENLHRGRLIRRVVRDMEMNR